MNHEFRLDHIAEDAERVARMDQGPFASDRFDLKPCFSCGDKLLMGHGGSDPQVPAEGSILYRDGVRPAVFVRVGHGDASSGTGRQLQQVT